VKASLNWLKRLVDLTESPEEIAAHLTAAGLEVEEWHALGELPGVVVAEVRSCEKVEGTKLSRCAVWDGSQELPVVCGAANVRVGLKVALATVGSVLPGGLEIKPATIRGMESRGMLCAEDELGLGEGHEGILELDPNLPAGAPFATACGVADVVFEINVTPNRPDATGHLGLARELALRLGRTLRNPLDSVTLPPPSGPATVPVELVPGSGCTRYVGRTLEGLRNGPSPAWMRNLLRAVGLRPISALVDITNFVQMEIGQPLHAFDLAKLRGGKVVVRGARVGESLLLLDGRNLSLTPGDLVIADAEGPRCLGGVMGGADSGVSEATTGIFLETARFEPSAIRYLARRTQCASDSSYRFERGVDPFATRSVSDYATALVLSLCGGTASAAQDLSTPEQPAARTRVRLRRSKVSGLLGMDVPDSRVSAFLNGIGCEAIGSDADSTTWEIPGWRPDIASEADLVEEIARLVGYDNIPSSFPSFPIEAVELPSRETWTRRLRRAMASRGLSETLSLRLIGQSDHDLLGLPESDPRHRLVALLNPLSDETACLPRFALSNLLKAAARNARRQERSVRLFECGRVFGRDLPEAFGNHRRTGIGEAGRWAGIVSGPWPSLRWRGGEADAVPRASWRAPSPNSAWRRTSSPPGRNPSCIPAARRGSRSAAPTSDSSGSCTPPCRMAWGCAVPPMSGNWIWTPCWPCSNRPRRPSPRASGSSPAPAARSTSWWSATAPPPKSCVPCRSCPRRRTNWWNRWNWFPSMKARGCPKAKRPCWSGSPTVRRTAPPRMPKSTRSRTPSDRRCPGWTGSR